MDMNYPPGLAPAHPPGTPGNPGALGSRGADAGDIALAQGLIAELNATLERARDERFRLLRLVKDAEARLTELPGVAQPPQPNEMVERLVQKIEAVEAAVKKRLESLKTEEDQVKQRHTALVRMDAGIRELAAQFAEQVERAKNFDREIEAARHRIAAEAGDVADAFRAELEPHLAKIDAVAADVDRLAERFEGHKLEAERVIGQCGATLERQLTRAMRDFEQAIVQVAEPVYDRLEDALAQADTLMDNKIAAAQQSLREKLEAVDVDAERMVAPIRHLLSEIITRAHAEAENVRESMAARLEALVEERIDAHRGALADRESALCDELARRFDEYAASLTEQFNATRQQIASELTAQHASQCEQISRRMSEAADQAVDAVSHTLQARVAQIVAGAETKGDEVVTAMQRKVADAYHESHTESERAAADLRKLLSDVRDQAEAQANKLLDDTTASLREKMVQAMAKAQSIAEPFSQRLDASLDEHGSRLDALLAKLREATDEHVLRVNEELAHAIAGIERKAGAVLADFEKRAEEAMGPFEARLNQRLEQLRNLAHDTTTFAENGAELVSDEGEAAAQQAVRQVEEQLARRILALKPQAEAELEAIEQALQERSKQIVGELRSQMLQEMETIAERTQHVRQLIASLKPNLGGTNELAAIVDPERTLDALDKLAQRLGYRVEPAATRPNETQQAA